MGQRVDGRALLVGTRHARGEGRREGGERLRLGQLRLTVTDADLHSRECEVRAHAPPELRVLGHRARLVEEAYEALELIPGGEGVRDSAAWEEAREDLCPRRVQARVDSFDERGAGRE